MTRLIKITIVVLSTLFAISTQARAASENVNADPLPACSSSLSGAVIIPNFSNTVRQCGATPSSYSITVYEMGVCASHPYGASKGSSTFDASTCEVVYTDATATSTDIAGSIGTASSLPGTSTLPPTGTYGFPYILFKNEFKISGTFTSANGTVTTSDASNALKNSGTPVVITESLDDFGAAANCQSGYVGATVTGATIDGFIADANKEREVTGAANCNAHKTHLAGVLTLTAPFTITPQTYGLNFKFNLTGQGVQFIDTTGTANGIPNEFSSAPFSGTFEVLNQD
jgi:hypothetical protein